MRQTIRIKTFETNSSSYHTLSIYYSKDKPKQKQIIKGQDLVIVLVPFFCLVWYNGERKKKSWVCVFYARLGLLLLLNFCKKNFDMA